MRRRVVIGWAVALAAVAGLLYAAYTFDLMGMLVRTHVPPAGGHGMLKKGIHAPPGGSH